MRIIEFILLGLRIILAAVFLLAGATKLVDPRGTRKALRDFGLPSALARPTMLLLPLAEIAVGMALLVIGLAWYGACGAAALLGLFLLATAIAMIRGRKPDCHCFGQLHSAPVGWRTIIRNGILAAAAGLLVWMGRAYTGPDIWAWVASLEGIEFKIAIAIGCVIGFVFFGLAARAKPHPQAAAAQPEPEAETEPEGEAEPEPEPARKPSEATAVATARPEAQPEPLRRPRQAPAPPTRPVRNPLGIGLPIGTAAPDFELPAVTGERRSLRALRDRGNDVLLIFTSPYCQSCEALAPNLVRWSRELQGLPNVVIISRGTPKENVEKLKEFAPSWVLLQRESEVSEAYDVNSTPSAVLVGSDGRVRSELVVGSPEIRKLLESHARRKSP